MGINKKLIGDIASHIVNIRALNANILINKYKITRGKLDSIIEILIEVKIVEFVSFTEPYKVLPETKEELVNLLNDAYSVIDNKEKVKAKKVAVPRTDNNALIEIKDTLKRIEERLTKLEQPQKNIRIKNKRR